MPMRWFYKLICWAGLHQWVYDMSVLDMSWSDSRPVLRACSRCGTRHERFYNSYSHGGYGGWEKQRRTV